MRKKKQCMNRFAAWFLAAVTVFCMLSVLPAAAAQEDVSFEEPAAFETQLPAADELADTPELTEIPQDPQAEVMEESPVQEQEIPEDPEAVTADDPAGETGNSAAIPEDPEAMTADGPQDDQPDPQDSNPDGEDLQNPENENPGEEDPQDPGEENPGEDPGEENPGGEDPQDPGESRIPLGQTKLISVSSGDGGILIQWEETAGAEGYYIYYWRSDIAAWRRFASTDGTSYTDTSVTAGNRYWYTVQPYNQDGTGAYDEDGLAGVYLPAAAVTSISNVQGGITFSWNESAGASGYRIYWREGPDGNFRAWKDVTGTSLTDSAVASGKTYEYLVVPFAQKGNSKYFGSWDLNHTGSILYLSVPTVSVSSAAGGIQISWKQIAGASGYDLFFWRSSDKTWVRFASTDQISYVDQDVKEGNRYWYTVRAKNGDTLGAYDEDGVAGMHLSGTKITSITSANNAVTFRWNAVNGASGYRICWRFAGEDWHAWKDVTETSLTDTSLKSGSDYEYLALPYKTFGSSKLFGTFDESNKGSISFLGQPVLVSASYGTSGITVKWNASAGATKYIVYWRHMNSDTGSWKKLAETTSTQYVDSKLGSATGYYYTVQAVNNKTVSSYDKTGVFGMVNQAAVMAAAKLNQVGWNLRAAYNWSTAINYISSYTGETTITSAVYAFTYGQGDCIAKASSFYWMAKLLGYSCNVILGQVPYASGGYGTHAWVEVYVNGVTYVCDPDFEWDEGRNGYFIQYGQSGTWRYIYGYILSDY